MRQSIFLILFFSSSAIMAQIQVQNPNPVSSRFQPKPVQRVIYPSQVYDYDTAYLHYRSFADQMPSMSGPSARFGLNQSQVRRTSSYETLPELLKRQELQRVQRPYQNQIPYRFTPKAYAQGYARQPVDYRKSPEVIQRQLQTTPLLNAVSRSIK